MPGHASSNKNQSKKTTMEKMRKEQEDEFVVFQQVDPILRTLLGIIQELKNYSPDTGLINTAETHVLPHYFNLVRSQQQTLQSLHQTLQHLFKTPNQSEESIIWNANRRAALVFLGEYITVPLIHILHNSLPKTTNPDSTATTTTTRMMQDTPSSIQTAIQFTLQCACIEEASHILTFFFHQIFQHVSPLTLDEQTTTVGDSDSTLLLFNRNRRLNDTSLQTIIPLRQKCIMACVWAVQSILKKTQQQGQQVLDMDKDPHIRKEDSFLYKGDDCITSLLSCIQIILLGSENTLLLNDVSYMQSLYHQNSRLMLGGERQGVDNHPSMPTGSKETIMEFQESTSSSKNHNNNNMSILDITNLWGDGGFFVLLIESCISLLTMNEGDVTATSSSSTETTLWSHHRHHTTVDTSSSSSKGNVSIQVASLRILETLLFFTDDNSLGKRDDRLKEKWRLIFPGCFVALCRVLRTHVQGSHTKTSSKVIAHSLLVLAWLIRTTMVVSPNRENVLTDSKKEKDILQTKSTLEIQRWVHREDVSQDPDRIPNHPKKEDGDGDPFWINMRSRVPLHLVQIIHLLRNQSSIYVKRIAVDCFCRCLLVDTFESWIGNSNVHADHVKDDALTLDGEWMNTIKEYILTMITDANENVASLSQEVICLHESLIPIPRWKRYGVIVDRIIESIQCLRTLAQAQRNEELSMTTRLICGYLSLISTWDTNASGFISNLEVRLSDKDTWKYIIDILVLDPSIITSVNNMLIPVEPSSFRSSGTIILYTSEAVTFKYLTKNSFCEVQILIRKMGRVLGWKKCVLLIDSLIADLYDMFLDRTRLYGVNHDKYHGDWISSKCGVLLTVNELLQTADPGPSANSFLSSALATAILPLILCESMWNLPTLIEATKIVGMSKSSTKANDEQILSSFFKTDLPLFQLPLARPFAQDVSIQALQANALFVSIVLDIIGSLSFILQTGILRFLPSILYPIVQKATDINHSFVQQAAQNSLHRICIAADFPSLTDLFSRQIDLLMENITRDLHASSVGSGTQHFYNIIIGINCMLRVVEQLISKFISEPLKMKDHKLATIQNLQLLDVIEALISWFDANFDKSYQSLTMLIEVPLGLLKVFVVSSRYLSSLIHSDTDFSTRHSSSSEIKKNTSPWIDSLQEFLVEPIGHTENEDSPDNDRDTTEKDNVHVSANSTTFMKRTAKASRRMMSLTSFFFSLEDVRVQRYTCEALKYALLTLGRIENYVKVHSISAEQDSDLMNPLLVSVSYFWPNIELNLRSFVNKFLRERSNVVYTLNEDRHLPQKQLREDINNTLQLVVVCCDLSGDFMAERFKTGAWPEIHKLLAYYINTKQDLPKPKHTLRDCNMMDPSLLHQVISDILTSLEELFSMEHFAYLLHDIIPVLGTFLSTLWGDNSDLGNKSFTLTKALLKLDCDTLWRPLTTLASRSVDDLLHDRATSLIIFIDTLPEQSI